MKKSRLTKEEKAMIILGRAIVISTTYISFIWIIIHGISTATTLY